MLRAWWERLSRVDAASARGRMVFLMMVMGVATLFSLLEVALAGNLTPLLAAGLGWAVVLLYGVFEGAFSGRSAAALVLPSGKATPPVAQHSNIEAMAARGDYAGAAAAYRAALESDPGDVVACEKLGRLASAELRDYHLAVFAYQEAARRSPDPRRQLGYRLLAAGILRDHLEDPGRTIVEYRRILDQWPDVPGAARLKAEIEELKAMHFEAR